MLAFRINVNSSAVCSYFLSGSSGLPVQLVVVVRADIFVTIEFAVEDRASAVDVAVVDRAPTVADRMSTWESELHWSLLFIAWLENLSITALSIAACICIESGRHGPRMGARSMAPFKT
jgi:hypothetical protein